MLDESGQAGISDEDYAASFGITPQMIEAGYEAFCFAVAGVGISDVGRDTVVQIYLAMIQRETPSQR